MSAHEPPRRPWLALGTTLAAQVLASLALSAAPVLAPVVAPELGLAPEQVGVYMAAAYALAMLSGLASAGWVARLGPTRLTAGLLLVLAVGGLVIAFSRGGLLPLVAAALIGMGYGMANPAAADILGRHAPPGSPGLFFALKQAGVPAGVALAGLAMPLGMAVLGWRATAAAMAAVCLVAAMATLPSAARLDAGRPRTRSAGPGWLATVALVLRRPALTRLSLVSMAFATTQQCFITFAVAWLYLERGLPLTVAAGLLALSQAASVLVRIAMGHVADRWVAPHRLLSWFGLAMGASCLGLALLPQGVSVSLALLAMVATGATAMGWNGVFFAHMLRIVPREELAASAGGTQFFLFSGGMVGPLAFAWVVHGGASHALGYGVLAVLATLAGLAMWRPDAAERPQPVRPLA